MEVGPRTRRRTGFGATGGGAVRELAAGAASALVVGLVLVRTILSSAPQGLPLGRLSKRALSSALARSVLGVGEVLSKITPRAVYRSYRSKQGWRRPSVKTSVSIYASASSVSACSPGNRLSAGQQTQIVV